MRVGARVRPVCRTGRLWLAAAHAGREAKRERRDDELTPEVFGGATRDHESCSTKTTPCSFAGKGAGPTGPQAWRSKESAKQSRALTKRTGTEGTLARTRASRVAAPAWVTRFRSKLPHALRNRARALPKRVGAHAKYRGTSGGSPSASEGRQGTSEAHEGAGEALVRGRLGSALPIEAPRRASQAPRSAIEARQGACEGIRGTTKVARARAKVARDQAKLARARAKRSAEESSRTRYQSKRLEAQRRRGEERAKLVRAEGERCREPAKLVRERASRARAAASAMGFRSKRFAGARYVLRQRCRRNTLSLVNTASFRLPDELLGALERQAAHARRPKPISSEPPSSNT